MRNIRVGEPYRITGELRETGKKKNKKETIKSKNQLAEDVLFPATLV